MKMYHIITVAIMAILLAPLVASAVQNLELKNFFTAVNIAGTHEGGCITRTAEGSGIASRHLLVTPGTAPATQVKVCTATTEPCGLADDVAADGQGLTVERLAANAGTRLGVASKAIAAEARLYTTAGGKITDTAVNNSWLVGKAVTVGVADTEIEFEPCFPVQQSV